MPSLFLILKVSHSYLTVTHIASVVGVALCVCNVYVYIMESKCQKSEYRSPFLPLINSLPRYFASVYFIAYEIMLSRSMMPVYHTELCIIYYCLCSWYCITCVRPYDTLNNVVQVC